MLMNILVAIGLAVLVALYKFLPDKKIFVGVCLAGLTVFGVSAFVHHMNAKTAEDIREQQAQVYKMRMAFVAWYANYQKDIDRLDRNWQLYHSIIENLKSAEVYEYSTYEQLDELSRDAIDEQIHIHNLQVPPELDAESAELLESVLQKTRTYSDAQTKVITTVKDAANPESVTDLNALNAKIRDVTLRESPEILFTASEIAEIRDRLTMNGEPE